jgi:NitT/TauT family transport system substrate-binding protein
VRITVPSLSATAIQYYIARDEGFFTRRGLDVELNVNPAALGLQAMLAGEFDFAGAVGTSVTAALNDAPIRIVIINFDRPMSWLFARPGITALPELRGKTLAVSAPGSLDDANARQLLRGAGVDADREVVFLNIGTPDARLAPLLAGAVEAAVLVLPGNVHAKQAGMTELAFFGDHMRGAYAGLSTTTQTIQERRDLVKATVAAVSDAVEFYHARPTEAKGHLQRVLELEPGMVDGMYDSVKLGFTADGTMSLEAQRDNIRATAAGANADPTTDPSQVFDFSIMREANAERGRR